MTAEIPNLKILLIGNSSVGKSSLLLRFSNPTFLPPDEASATIGVDFKVKSITLRERVEEEYEEPTQDQEPEQVTRGRAGDGDERIGDVGDSRADQPVRTAARGGQAGPGGRRVKLSIWDTAGQERFRVITGSYYRGAQGVILVYDISSRSSFEEMLRWLREVDTYCPQDICKILVGNKVDRPKVVGVASTGEARQKADPSLWRNQEGQHASLVGELDASRDSAYRQELSRQVTTAEGRELARRVGMGFIECSAMNNTGVNEVFERLAQMILDDPDVQTAEAARHRGALRLTSGEGSDEDEDDEEDDTGRGRCSC